MAYHHLSAFGCSNILPSFREFNRTEIQEFEKVDLEMRRKKDKRMIILVGIIVLLFMMDDGKKEAYNEIKVQPDHYDRFGTWDVNEPVTNLWDGSFSTNAKCESGHSCHVELFYEWPDKADRDWTTYYGPSGKDANTRKSIPWICKNTDVLELYLDVDRSRGVIELSCEDKDNNDHIIETNVGIGVMEELAVFHLVQSSSCDCSFTLDGCCDGCDYLPSGTSCGTAGQCNAYGGCIEPSSEKTCDDISGYDYCADINASDPTACARVWVVEAISKKGLVETIGGTRYYVGDYSIEHYCYGDLLTYEIDPTSPSGSCDDFGCPGTSISLIGELSVANPPADIVEHEIRFNCWGKDTQNCGLGEVSQIAELTYDVTINSGTAVECVVDRHCDEGYVCDKPGDYTTWTCIDSGASDSDGDGVADDVDNCPDDANADQANNDGDNHGNVCDNCPDNSNNDQADFDTDDIGDVCDACTDVDGDGYGNPGYSNTCDDDNCPNVYNPGQEDSDSDGIGDACESATCSDSDSIGRTIIQQAERYGAVIYDGTTYTDVCKNSTHVEEMHCTGGAKASTVVSCTDIDSSYECSSGKCGEKTPLNPLTIITRFLQGGTFKAFITEMNQWVTS